MVYYYVAIYISQGITDGSKYMCIYKESVNTPEHVFQAEGHQLRRTGSRKRNSSQMALCSGSCPSQPRGIGGACVTRVSWRCPGRSFQRCCTYQQRITRLFRFCSWPQLVLYIMLIPFAAAAPSVTAESNDSSVGLCDFAAGTVIRCAEVN